MLIASGSNDTVVKVVRAVTWEDPVRGKAWLTCGERH